MRRDTYIFILDYEDIFYLNLDSFFFFISIQKKKKLKTLNSYQNFHLNLYIQQIHIISYNNENVIISF